MYARLWRRWSLNTNRMSFMWLAVATLLLLIMCAPTTTTTTPLPLTTTTTTATTKTTRSRHQATAADVAAAAAAAMSDRRPSWRNVYSAAAASPSPAAAIPATEVGAAEESFFIPVAASRAGSSSSRFAQQPPVKSPSSSNRSRRKTLSSSHQQQPHADSALYAGVGSVFAGLQPPPAARREQQRWAKSEESDDEDETDDVEESDDDVESEEETEAEDEPDTEAEGDSGASDERVVDNSAAAAPSADNNHNNFNRKRVPFSQIKNSRHTLTNTHINSITAAAAAANVHGAKARRHAEAQRQQVSPAAGFHSPVRETATVSSKPLPPFRYLIEAFEIPATLPFSGELTQQQRRMLLKAQQTRLQLEQQQQAARNRRDSRVFGSMRDGSGYQQHFHTAKKQLQQQQLQPYQRLQQQHQITTSNNYQKPPHNTHQQQQPPQHQHQHHPRQHQQQQQRNRRRRYCSARDPAQLAFEAPTVFEGKIVSMTPDRRTNFSATVEVKEIFKQQIGFRLQKYLRLQFAYRNSSGECDIYREQLRPRGLVRGDELEQGRIYLLFVQQIDMGNFTILGQPIRKTRRVIEAVKNAVSENYAQLAAIRSITASNRTAESGKELRIVCKVQGRPPPKVTWFKDHKSINRNRRLYQIVPFKKRSELIIRSFNASDAGRYECRAKNKVNRNLERRAIVIKAYPVPRYETHLTGGTGHSCPPDAAEFCFNGGTCKLFVEIGSYSCICPEGFIGERCDRKEVNNMPPNPTYKTGYIADDPNAYVNAQQHDVTTNAAEVSRFPSNTFVDNANDNDNDDDSDDGDVSAGDEDGAIEDY